MNECEINYMGQKTSDEYFSLASSLQLKTRLHLPPKTQGLHEVLSQKNNLTSER